MTYVAGWERAALKEFENLPHSVQAAVYDAIRALEADPRPPGCRKLVGQVGWRIRVGDYRVVYEINDPEHGIAIVQIGHRREVYQ